MTIYGVDVASYQGNPSWSSVYSAGIRFGFSKVTESTSYVNPTWAHNRAGMLGLGDKFLGGAYHFLHGGSGAAQARYFLSKAGDVSQLAVALDVEASGADAATSREWVAEFKDKTGGHPVIGYFPRWYWEQTGRPDLSFFDTIWQSAYVSGSGAPASLYGKVPSSWWATFGNEPISILQFTDAGVVSGISGKCDVSAYRGTIDELRALALGEDNMAISDDDVKKIAKAVWQADIIPSPPWIAEKGNANWQPSSYLHWQYRQGADTQAAVAALAKDAPQVDTGAIIAGVLAGLSPDAIAEKLAAALPDDLAKQVVDALAARLAS